MQRYNYRQDVCGDRLAVGEYAILLLNASSHTLHCIEQSLSAMVFPEYLL
jgi:hypothetical protein